MKAINKIWKTFFYSNGQKWRKLMQKWKRKSGKEEKKTENICCRRLYYSSYENEKFHTKFSKLVWHGLHAMPVFFFLYLSGNVSWCSLQTQKWNWMGSRLSYLNSQCRTCVDTSISVLKTILKWHNSLFQEALQKEHRILPCSNWSTPLTTIRLSHNLLHILAWPKIKYARKHPFKPTNVCGTTQTYLGAERK